MRWAGTKTIQSKVDIGLTWFPHFLFPVLFPSPLSSSPIFSLFPLFSITGLHILLVFCLSVSWSENHIYPLPMGCRYRKSQQRPVTIKNQISLPTFLLPFISSWILFPPFILTQSIHTLLTFYLPPMLPFGSSHSFMQKKTNCSNKLLPADLKHDCFSFCAQFHKEYNSYFIFLFMHMLFIINTSCFQSLSW